MTLQRSIMLGLISFTFISCVSIDNFLVEDKKSIAYKSKEEKNSDYVIKKNNKVIWRKTSSPAEHLVFNSQDASMINIQEYKGFLINSRFDTKSNAWIHTIKNNQNNKLIAFYHESKLPYNDHDLIQVSIKNHYLIKETLIVKDFKKNKKNNTEKKIQKKLENLKKRTLSRKTPWISEPAVENIDLY